MEYTGYTLKVLCQKCGTNLYISIPSALPHTLSQQYNRVLFLALGLALTPWNTQDIHLYIESFGAKSVGPYII